MAVSNRKYLPNSMQGLIVKKLDCSSHLMNCSFRSEVVKDQEADHVKRIAEFAVEAVAVAKTVPIDTDDLEKGCVNIRVGKTLPEQLRKQSLFHRST